MHTFRSNFGRCQSLWQVANVVGKGPWYQPLSLSSVNADSGEREEVGAFGLLSSNPSSEFYERGRRKRYTYVPDSLVPNSKGQTEFEEEKTSSSAASEVRKTFQKERALERWHKFKSASDEKIVRLSQNLVQDDDEEEYLKYISNNPNLRGKKFNKRNSSSKGSNENDESLGELPTAQVSHEDEPFGKLSPPKNCYEHEQDEGDEIQRKYEEAMLGRRHKPAYYGNRMKKLCRERKLLDALKILEEEMPAAAAKPDHYCYQVLINACGRAGYTKKAFELYNRMKKRGLEVQPVGFTGLFNACAHSPWPTTDGLARALKLREQLKEKGYIFNQTTSHAMIKAFGRCGDIKTAFQIVDEMLEQGLLVTIETISFMLQACITDRETGFRYALLVWRKMRELRLAPNIYTYNLLVQCVNTSKAGDPTLTTQLLEAGHKPSGNNKINKKKNNEKKTFVKVIGISVGDSDSKDLEKDSVELPRSDLKKYSESTSENKSDQLEILEPNHRIEELRRKVSSGDAELQLLPNLLGKRITTGCAIGLSSLDQPEDRLALLGGAVGLFKQMTHDRVTPNLKTFTQIIDSLPSTTEAEAALLQSMNIIGLTPDTQFCNMLIRKRCFRHDMDSAKAMLDLMQEHHLLPDLITFGCLALGCKNLHSATELLSDMDAAGFRPNLEIMTILVKNSVMKQNYFYTLEMLREIHDKDISPNEDLLLFLEDARIRARETMLKMETGKFDDIGKERRLMENIKLFLLEYKNWLKNSKVQLHDHPWAQYRFAKANL